MCGRFAQFSPVSLLREAFDIRAVKCNYVQSYNTAPSQEALAVLYCNEMILTKFLWGISPRIYKKVANPPLLINARLETIAEKASFREAYRLRRCLVPSDGFYEWEKAGAKKQPWFFTCQSNRPFAFAGIWEKRKGKDESGRYAFAIITKEAVVPVSNIHNRMPVILDKKVYEHWLNPDENDPKNLKDIIQEGVTYFLKGYPVSRKVNAVANNDPSCIAPLDPEGKLLL